MLNNMVVAGCLLKSNQLSHTVTLVRTTDTCSAVHQRYARCYVGATCISIFVEQMFYNLSNYHSHSTFYSKFIPDNWYFVLWYVSKYTKDTHDVMWWYFYFNSCCMNVTFTICPTLSFTIPRPWYLTMVTWIRTLKSKCNKWWWTLYYHDTK